MCIFDSRTKTILPLLLRETEALMAWLDFLVKKETEWVILWQKVCMWARAWFWSVLLVNLNVSIVAGWIWTFWTPWCSRRGWREGNIETLWLYEKSYDAMLNDTRRHTFPWNSSFMLVCFGLSTPLPAANLPRRLWWPAAQAIWSPGALFLLVSLLSPFSRMHLHCHTWTSHATHITLFFCFHSSSAPHSDLCSLFLPGRRWRDRTQGTSWWISEWSHVLTFILV